MCGAGYEACPSARFVACVGCEVVSLDCYCCVGRWSVNLKSGMSHQIASSRLLFSYSVVYRMIAIPNNIVMKKMNFRCNINESLLLIKS